MADPKYANLFGIAYDQPDVYETADLPEDDQDKDIYDQSSLGNSDCIERLHISASDALSTFRGKSLIPRNVDFSDRLSEKVRTGYDARWWMKSAVIYQLYVLTHMLYIINTEVSTQKSVTRDFENIAKSKVPNGPIEVITSKIPISYGSTVMDFFKFPYFDRSGDWELAGIGEKETPIQKYQRLQCEMTELLEEISTLKGVAKDENSKDSLSYPTVHTQLEKMQKQLSDMQLEETLGTELISSLSDPQGAQYKKLMAHLETFHSGGGTSNLPAGGDKASVGDGLVQYQVTLKPGHIQLEKTSRLTELEQRIAKMESMVGATPPKLARLGGGDRSLLETAQWLSSRAAILDPAQLDAAEARVSALSSKLDHVAEKTTAITGSLDPEKEKKISELYEIAKKTEKLSQIIPQTLDRLISLQELHQQGGEFAKTLGELESMQVRLAANAASNKELLQNVEENLKTNLSIVKSNMESLDSRINKLNSKK